MSSDARLPSAPYRGRSYWKRSNLRRPPEKKAQFVEDAQPNELLTKRNSSGPPVVRSSAPISRFLHRGRGAPPPSGRRHPQRLPEPSIPQASNGTSRRNDEHACASRSRGRASFAQGHARGKNVDDPALVPGPHTSHYTERLTGHHTASPSSQWTNPGRALSHPFSTPCSPPTLTSEIL
ncbi:hypothetical protein BD413DRAFT_236446 [Trametes elegans]|nr:hypothetical protein BD413DRAFT_236446 [Trametes elegans]